MTVKPDPNEPVTRTLLDQAVDAILNGIGNLVTEEVNQLRQEMRSEFKMATAARNSLKIETSYVRDEIRGLKADLSSKADRGELNDLSETVDRLRLSH